MLAARKQRDLLRFAGRDGVRSGAIDGCEERRRFAGNGGPALGGNHFRARLHAQNYAARQAFP